MMRWPLKSVTDRALRGFGVAALVAGLAGCESVRNFTDYYSWSDWGMLMDENICSDAGDRVLAGVDFSEAKVIDIRVRNEEFTPMIVELTQNRPYILRVSNRDNEDRLFAARDFFRNTAISAVAIDNELLEQPCRSIFKLRDKQTLEIQLFTLSDGHFEFHDSSNIMPYAVPTGAAGIINVEMPPS